MEPSQSHHQHDFLKGLKTLDTSDQVGLEEHPAANEEKTKVGGDNKPKVWRSQKLTSTQKATFKAPKYGLEDKVFGFFKQSLSVEFGKNCK